MGHSYIVYAPLFTGCTTIFYEGKPVKTPDAGAFWRVVQDHKVNMLFTAPTAFRAVRKEDPEADQLSRYDVSSLNRIFLAGEHLSHLAGWQAGAIESSWQQIAKLHQRAQAA